MATGVAGGVMATSSGGATRGAIAIETSHVEATGAIAMEIADAAIAIVTSIVTGIGTATAISLGVIVIVIEIETSVIEIVIGTGIGTVGEAATGGIGPRDGLVISIGTVGTAGGGVTGMRSPSTPGGGATATTVVGVRGAIMPAGTTTPGTGGDGRPRPISRHGSAMIGIARTTGTTVPASTFTATTM